MSGETTLELDESHHTERRSGPFVLRWVFPPAALGQSVPLPHGATIGRAEESSIRLSGEGVSRHLSQPEQ